MSQNSEETDDLRVRRTRRTLQEALLELTVEKGFGAVTVRDITERAMVNRSTFYRHYLDKYELLEQYIKEVGALASMEDLPDDQNPHTDGEAPSNLVKMLKHIQKYADFYRIMLGQKGDPIFTERFRQNTASNFRFLLSGVEVDPSAPPLEMKLSYVSYAGTGAILWWLENGQPCTPEQFARWLSYLSVNGMGVPPMPGRQ